MHFCWAAVTVAIAEAYGAGGETQCEVADRVLGGKCCATAFSSPSSRCDQPLDLPQALGPFCARESREPADRTPEYIKGQIDAGAPVAVRVLWTDSNGGHFVVISGYIEANGHLDLTVLDPTDGLRRVWRYERFVAAYQETGRWDITFETRGANRVPAE